MADKNDASIKKMAELLRRGATMLAQACPQCGSPLFKVGNDTYCAMCDRRIVIMRSDQKVETPADNMMISQLKETLIRKLKNVNELVESENDVESLTRLARLMVLFLQALHRLESMSRVGSA